MKYSYFVMGNSSSGIIEAASFNKFNINLGDRQKGRLASKNTFHCAIHKNDIINAVYKIEKLGSYDGDNIYYQKNTSSQIAQVLKGIIHGE
jgi:GDP/UDP-N,N'-diacetylbacillosamine 2-epimerase (hydrolysing)